MLTLTTERGLRIHFFQGVRLPEGTTISEGDEVFPGFTEDSQVLAALPKLQALTESHGLVTQAYLRVQSPKTPLHLDSVEYWTASEGMEYVKGEILAPLALIVNLQEARYVTRDFEFSTQRYLETLGPTAGRASQFLDMLLRALSTSTVTLTILNWGEAEHE